MKKILFAALALSLVASCANQEGSSPVQSELRLKSQIVTRAQNTTWDADDRIGVFMFESGTEQTVGLGNTPYITLEESINADFKAVTTPLYYPQSEKVDILAYYPYSEDLDGTLYQIETKEQEQLSKIDLMTASKSQVEKSEDALAMTFVHRLSKVTINLVPSDGVAVEDLQDVDTKVVIEGLTTSATCDLFDGTTELGEDKADITLNSILVTSGSTAFEGIVIPQSETFTILVSTYKYGNFSVEVKGQNFETGIHHTYKVNVSRTAISVDGSATIEEWTPKSEEDLNADDLGGM